ncbi:hypothetical protein [Candidatus Protofrankia californiensis]|uniref:hypothetical protein n=1 Tax=Candidatus Protofrankia californiensis TaxID=1839754 RepID=UPI0019D0AF29|nr:hypothetical protein [Candidatus Protofrankia californiensis]
MHQAIGCWSPPSARPRPSEGPPARRRPQAAPVRHTIRGYATGRAAASRSPAGRDGRVCYGYLSLDHDDEDEISRLHDLLSAYAHTGGLTLAETYVDRNTLPVRIIRLGLTALLDAVSRGGGCTVLIPTPAHLSPVPAVRAAITAELDTLGAWTIILRAGEHPASPALVGRLPRPRQPLPDDAGHRHGHG